MVLLSLRRRRKQGPTLPSRLAGVADDCLLRLVIRLEARLDNRRIRLPLPVLLVVAVEAALLAMGAMPLLLL